MPLTNGIIDGLAAVRNESADEREKYRTGWDNIFNKKPPVKEASKDEV